MISDIVLATGNEHKTAEIREILAPYGIAVASARDLGGMPPVVEDGGTFLENAARKALAGARAFRRLVLADDSGLEVAALGGRPGVRSARYAGEDCVDRRNLARVLRELEGAADRRARFVCALVLASPDGVLASATGEVRGRMAEAPRGDGGFGYDPAFIPEGYDRTFGELPAEVKNRLSHRSDALRNALRQGMFSGGVFFTWRELADITGGTWLVPPAVSPLAGAAGVQDDSRRCAPGDLFLAIAGGLADGHRFLGQAVARGACGACVQTAPAPALLEDLAARGRPCLQVDDSLAAFQRLASAHRRKFPELELLAVTGSCGKTSVKEMCAAVLERRWPGRVVRTEGNTNNHFGVPRNLLRITPETAAAVIEAGSSRPGEIARLASLLLPSLGLVCSIGHAHLESFGDLQGVAREKGDLFPAVRRGGVAVLPADGPGVEILRRKAAGLRTVTFGAGPEADVRGEYLGCNPEGGCDVRLTWRDPPLYLEFTWDIPGAHQALNAAAAAAAGTACGITPREIVAGLQRCRLPGKRLELTERNGVFWANDAYNANPDSMRAAFRWFAERSARAPRRILVLGDMRELGALSPGLHRMILAEAARTFPGDRILTIGPEMRPAAEKAGLENVPDVDAAYRLLKDTIRPGDWILLKASNSLRLHELPDRDWT